MRSLPFATWTCGACPPGSVTSPDQLATASPDWLPAPVPGTVAAALRSQGKWDEQRPHDLDASDWWYRTTFAAPLATGSPEPWYLVCDGLATRAEIWLNGTRLLATDNMFRGYALEISQYLQSDNELVLVFRSLTADLKRKRPRPRWKTNLVSQQQLRWQRSSLLGRIPGWTPPVPIIGPWRDIRVTRGPILPADVHVRSELEGTTGIVLLDARIQDVAGLTGVRWQVGDQTLDAEMIHEEQGARLRARVSVPDAPLWWPHTHGSQPLLPWQLICEMAGTSCVVATGAVGFRQLEVLAAPDVELGGTVRREPAVDGGFEVRINGVPVYCRGACWTIGDLWQPLADEASLRHDLQLAVAAGMNMLRVGGTMTYESDRFYRLCDELGILVWQDFMLANMDYPVDDPGFRETLETEVRQQLTRLSAHPSVAIYCGGSEIEQQAAMLGMPRALWRQGWFGDRLPQLCGELHPGTAYVPSTPTGGVQPFHVRRGITHYYGVGAYLRSPRELRQADVKFTTECLGFAHLPEPETMHEITGGSLPVAHHPRWKQRVPRDTGPGWDFEDVRDHYLRARYAVDPVELRSFDMARYVQLSRLVPGELMSEVFAEWRSGYSHNRGGLVWFYKDLWPASGWGIVDSHGRPKATYYYLRRSWQDRQILLTDEGLDSLHIHVINERPEPLRGTVELWLLKEPQLTVARREVGIDIPPRGQQCWNADELLEAFYDVTYAYRFGPAHHDLAAAVLYDEQRTVVSEAWYFLRPREPQRHAANRVAATVERVGDGDYLVTLHATAFLHGVRLAADGYLPDDNYFHLRPACPKTVRFRPLPGAAPAFHGTVEALNLEHVEFVELAK